MDEEAYNVECLTHGKQPATFVCQHILETLNDGIPRGFWWSTEDPENPRPDAWCNECEIKVNEAGEWNDETEGFAGVKLICGVCYDKVRALNLGKTT